MIKWEKDIRITFSNLQWEAAISSCLRLTKSSNLWDLMFKYNLRWYITPSQIHTFEPSTSPLCWRDCGMPGKLFHLLWAFKKIATFWKANLQLISDVTNTLLPPSPELALLNIGIDDYPHNLLYTIVHILLAAKLALVHHWRSPDHIPLSGAINLMHIHSPYEHMFATSEGHMQRANKQ